MFFKVPSSVMVFMGIVLFLTICAFVYHAILYIFDPNTATEVEKPWGGYRNIAEHDGYKVKMLVISPDECTSLQSHEHRKEVWVVAKGVASIEYEHTQFELQTGETLKVLAGYKHRITNNTIEPLVLVEVWYGKILDENDITRYEDKYGRIDEKEKDN
jgi:mannose-1-phosphate guanylyltransferase